jgi:DNA-binding transcriptional ArsR family regulator
MHARASASSRIFRFFIRPSRHANLEGSGPEVITASLMGHFETISHALRTPARRAILAWTEGRWMTITELAQELGYAVSTISHHVHVLRRAGLVLVERSGREAQVTARYRDHEIIIQRRPARYPVPVRVDECGGSGDQSSAEGRPGRG